MKLCCTRWLYFLVGAVGTSVKGCVNRVMVQIEKGAYSVGHSSVKGKVC